MTGAIKRSVVDLPLSYRSWKAPSPTASNLYTDYLDWNISTHLWTCRVQGGLKIETGVSLYRDERTGKYSQPRLLIFRSLRSLFMHLHSTERASHANPKVGQQRPGACTSSLPPPPKQRNPTSRTRTYNLHLLGALNISNCFAHKSRHVENEDPYQPTTAYPYDQLPPKPELHY